MWNLEKTECSDVLDPCENIDFNQTLLPPMYDYLQDFTIVPKYNLSLCQIPKVISTIGTATFCYLSDSKKFTENNRSISMETYDSRFCERNEVKSLQAVRRILGENSETIIVVRDPLDRFISGFTEKCVNLMHLNFCHGCEGDLRCFLRYEYRRLKRISMLFPVYSLPDTHFAPQTWFCDMKNVGKNAKFIKYGHHKKEGQRMVEEIVDVLRRNRVPESEIVTIQKELLKGKTSHSTSGNSQRTEIENLIRNDRSIRLALMRMYYYDYVTFNFPMLKF